MIMRNLQFLLILAPALDERGSDTSSCKIFACACTTFVLQESKRGTGGLIILRKCISI